MDEQQRSYDQLRVMADICSSGIWSCEPSGMSRHVMVDHESLGLTPDLAERFDAWIQEYDYRDSPSFDLLAFNREGMELARLLQRHVGTETKVVFAPEVNRGEEYTDQVVNI